MRKTQELGVCEGQKGGCVSLDKLYVPRGRGTLRVKKDEETGHASLISKCSEDCLWEGKRRHRREREGKKIKRIHCKYILPKLPFQKFYIFPSLLLRP